MRRGVGVGRRGPGVVGAVARTAVVAGTATVVAKGVSGSMDQKAVPTLPQLSRQVPNSA